MTERYINLKPWEYISIKLSYSHGSIHRMHRSALKAADINKLMGHSVTDTGERTYTHKTIDELKEAIEKIIL